jgi:hypothetical protein
MDKEIYQLEDKVICIDAEPLQGNEIAPPLETGVEYQVIGIINDRAGNQHLDVGLKSMYNYIRSFETKEDLKDGDKIHWCHPSRFIKV